MQPGRLGVADLDADEVIRTVDEAVRLKRMPDAGTYRTDDLLRCLGLLRGGHPVNAAAVLFGRADCLAGAYPQCTLRMARFAGTDASALAEGLETRQNVFQALRCAQRFIGHPSAAMRAALVTAMCRRDYGIAGGSAGVAIFADRVEVSYSGALRGSRPRNPAIARMLSLRGWRKGGGMDGAYEAPGHVVVRFQRHHVMER